MYYFNYSVLFFYFDKFLRPFSEFGFYILEHVTHIKIYPLICKIFFLFSLSSILKLIISWLFLQIPKISTHYKHYDDFGQNCEDFGRSYVQKGCLISELYGYTVRTKLKFSNQKFSSIGNPLFNARFLSRSYLSDIILSGS
jgi:hypothetical protein